MRVNRKTGCFEVGGKSLAKGRRHFTDTVCLRMVCLSDCAGCKLTKQLECFSIANAFLDRMRQASHGPDEPDICPKLPQMKSSWPALRIAGWRSFAPVRPRTWARARWNPVLPLFDRLHPDRRSLEKTPYDCHERWLGGNNTVRLCSSASICLVVCSFV